MKTRMLASAAVVALALSGCGSSSPSLGQFKTGFKANKASFRQLGLDLQHAITGAQTKTDSQLAVEISALARRASAQADQIAKLNPPAKYAAETHALTAGFRRVAADLRSITTAAVKHDVTLARAATITLLRDAATVKASDVAISKGLGLPPG